MEINFQDYLDDVLKRVRKRKSCKLSVNRMSEVSIYGKGNFFDEGEV